MKTIRRIKTIRAMKGQRFLIGVLLLGLLLALATGLALAQGPGPQGDDTSLAPLGSAFTYQGRLKKASGLVNSTCDFRFSLWGAASGGTQIGTTQTKPNVTVSEGLFTVQLDFGTGAFTGDARWLQIAVRCPAGSGTYATLSPRQSLTAAPYALSLRPGAQIHNKATSGTTRGLTLRSDVGTGLVVESAGWDGVAVGSAPNASGAYVGAAKYGVYVNQTSDDGVYVQQAGNPQYTTPSSAKNGFEVAGAEGVGLYVGYAKLVGVHVSSSGQHGVFVESAASTGVYANTEKLNQEWGFYTPDKIYAGAMLASGGPLMLVAQSGDQGNLEPGDVVAVSGTGAVFAESESPVALVQRAGQDGSAVMGVVYGRFVAEEKVEEVERDGQVEQRTRVHARSAEGPVAPGDYLLVVVLGPAQVKVEAASGAGIRPGDLLTAGPGGQAMKTSGAESYPPGTIVGQAMGVLDKTQGSGLIWMLVMPR